MEIVKKTVDKLLELIGLQQDSKSFSCLALLIVIIHQVIELLETGRIGLREKKDDQSAGAVDALDSIGSGIPIFGFRAFQMDAEEQRTWRAQIVVKELCRIERVVPKVAALSAPRAYLGQPDEPLQWCEGLGRRLAALRESLAQSEPQR